MDKKLPYISYMPRKSIESFLKSKIGENLTNNTPVLFCRWVYMPKTKIDFLVEVETPKKGRHTTRGTAMVEDFKCSISIGNIKKTYTKDWAQYVCDILSDKAYLEGLDFSAITYKNEYNNYWQRVKKDQIAKAEQECDEKLFK